MTSLSVLKTLLDIAEKTLQEATQAMAAANHVLGEEENKGGMLRQYRQDYLNGLADLQKKGISREVHLNYQNFLRKLDQAISGQEEVIVSARYQASKARATWQKAQQKQLSFEALQKRELEKLQEKTLKIEQKMMDEFAQRSKRQKAESA